MSKIDECGNIQYYAVTQSDVRRYRLKAKLIKFLANCYGLYWKIRYDK